MPYVDLKKLGHNIKALRTEAGLSQRDLAGMIGVTAASLSAYERGTQTPSIEVVASIAETLGVRIDWLCSRRYSLCFYRDDQKINQKNMEEALNGLMMIATHPDLMKIQINKDQRHVVDISFENRQLEIFLCEAYQFEELKQTRAFTHFLSDLVNKHSFELESELNSTIISSYASLILRELNERNGISSSNGRDSKHESDDLPF